MGECSPLLTRARPSLKRCVAPLTALVSRSDQIACFSSLDFYRSSSESGDVRYKSGCLNKTICSFSSETILEALCRAADGVGVKVSLSLYAFPPPPRPLPLSISPLSHSVSPSLSSLPLSSLYVLLIVSFSQRRARPTLFLFLSGPPPPGEYIVFL